MSLAKPNQMDIVRALLISLEIKRAGDRDRTGMASLEGWGSTIELHPRVHGLKVLGRQSEGEIWFRLHPCASGRSVVASAPALGAGDREFESPRPDQFVSVITTST